MLNESKTAEATEILTVHETIQTSGARAMSIFELDGHLTLAIPQLAEDKPGNEPARMNGGDSNTSLLLFRWTDRKFEPWQQLPLPGGEDAEYFEIDGRSFLATAGVRSGSGPYDHKTNVTIYEWKDGRFETFQLIPAFAAKNLSHFQMEQRHFLALSQGVTPAADEANDQKESALYLWDGSQFSLFQTIPSEWGYSFAYFKLDNEHYLGYADNAAPSIILRYNGSDFEHFQTLEGASGRAFHFFEQDGQAYLAFAVLHGDTVLYRWEEGKWVLHQALCGPGGREFTSFTANGDFYLVIVKFLTGTRQEPKFDLESLVLKFVNGQMVVVQSFPTLGATGATYFEADGQEFVAVSQSLTAAVRFRNESIIYKVSA